MSKESIDRIKNKTVSKNHPFKSGDVTIDILHVDVHPTREASITWKYSDGTSEIITMQGNGGTRFKDKSGKWTDWLNFGDHTEKLVQHMSLQKQYKFEKLNRQPGRNTWMLQTKSGGVTSVEISNPIENWSGLITIDLNWTAGTGLAKGPSKVPIKPAPRPCCKAMTAGCMACAAGLSVEEYCNRNPGRVGCPSKKIVCDPKTGPSTGLCPMARCGPCPPNMNCKYITEYKESGGRCCPIPCKRIETEKSCPDSGKGYGVCKQSIRPVDTNDHRFVALTPKWVKYSTSCCKETEYKKVPINKVCCKAMTKECLACQQDITVDAFCAKSQNSTYCTSHSPEPGVAPGPTPPGDVLPDPTETEEEDDVEEVVIEKVDTEEGGIPMPSTNAMIAAAVLMGGILALSR
jgi:hypothetical protein